jgi:uncharacterized small protein (DUF1192 family)
MSRTHIYLSKEAAEVVEFKDAEIHRLHAELAEAKAALAKYGDVGAFNALRDANDRAEQAEAQLAEANARIAALQGGVERYWEARWRDAEAQLAIAREALEYYACPEITTLWPSGCPSARLKDGTCIRAVSGECGETARAALQQISPATDGSNR